MRVEKVQNRTRGIKSLKIKLFAETQKERNLLTALAKQLYPNAARLKDVGMLELSLRNPTTVGYGKMPD